MVKLKLTVLLLILLTSTGCTDASLSKVQAIGAKHSIELYSGGVKVREWVSTEKF